MISKDKCSIKTSLHLSCLHLSFNSGNSSKTSKLKQMQLKICQLLINSFLDFRVTDSELAKSKNTNLLKEKTIYCTCFLRLKTYSRPALFNAEPTWKKCQVLTCTIGMNKRKSSLFFEVWLFMEEHFAWSIFMLATKTETGIELSASLFEGCMCACMCVYVCVYMFSSAIDREKI